MARRVTSLINSLSSLSRNYKILHFEKIWSINGNSEEFTRHEFFNSLSNNSLWQTQSRFAHVGTGSGGRAGGLIVRNPPEEMPYSVVGLNHIAIAVPNLEAAAEHYRTIFGAQVSTPMELPDHGVRAVFVTLSNTRIELLHPLGDNSPVANFLKRNPAGGLHHICLTVDDLKSAINHAKDEKLGLVGGGKPRIGAHNNPVVFLEPKTNHGVLCELEQVHFLETVDEAY